MSANASYMETFKLSLREIKKRFTKSELAMLAWTSRERYINMSKNIKTPVATKDADAHKDLISSVPAKYKNEDGIMDMSKMTGKDAVTILQNIGIPLVFSE